MDKEKERHGRELTDPGPAPCPSHEISPARGLLRHAVPSFAPLAARASESERSELNHAASGLSLKFPKNGTDDPGAARSRRGRPPDPGKKPGPVELSGSCPLVAISSGSKTAVAVTAASRQAATKSPTTAAVAAGLPDPAAAARQCTLSDPVPSGCRPRRHAKRPSKYDNESDKEGSDGEEDDNKRSAPSYSHW